MKKLLFFCLIALIPTHFVLSGSAQSIIINEIAWMGGTNSFNDEWIELYNSTDSSIDLSGWTLKAIDKTPKVNLSGMIQPKGFFLLERTDDNSVMGITADQIYTGALSNNGEHLQLFDSQNNLIDEINNTGGWSAGDNSTKQTMERALSGWQTSSGVGGTPKAPNSNSNQEQPPAETKNDEPESQPAISYVQNIVFSEILPSPEGADSENEWIEIFNQNDFDADLSSWKIRDNIGAMTTYTFPENTTIRANSYLVLGRTETKITLNNDSDKLELIQPNGNVLDQVAYEKAPRNQSYNLIGFNWQWSEALTPGTQNILKQTPAAQSNDSATPVNTSPDNKEKLTASARDFEDENRSINHNALLIALVLGAFSSIAIFFFKKRMLRQKIDF